MLGRGAWVKVKEGVKREQVWGLEDEPPDSAEDEPAEPKRLYPYATVLSERPSLLADERRPCEHREEILADLRLCTGGRFADAALAGRYRNLPDSRILVQDTQSGESYCVAREDLEALERVGLSGFRPEADYKELVRCSRGLPQRCPPPLLPAANLP